MRLALLLLALAACGGGAKTLRLPTFAPGLDAASVVDETTTTKSEVHQEDGVLTSLVVEHERSHRKVLAVEGTLVVRIAARYEIDETVTTDNNGQSTTEQGPLAGKSYTLWRDRDALEAEHADGSPITAVERAELNAEFRHLGTTSRADAFLTGRIWKPDELVPIDDDLIDEIALPEGTDVREATIGWIGGDAKTTTFRAFFVVTTVEGYDVQMTNDGRFDRATGRELGSKRTSILRAKVGRYEVVQTTDAVLTIEVE